MGHGASGPFYLAPFVLFVGGVIMAGMGMLAGYGIGGENGVALGGLVGLIGLVLFFYLGLGLIAVAFYAKFYREMVGATRWRDLRFSFEASTLDWVKLLLGDALLVVFTLDAVTPETYQRVKGRDALARVRRNIRHFIRQRARLDAADPENCSVS